MLIREIRQKFVEIREFEQLFKNLNGHHIENGNKWPTSSPLITAKISLLTKPIMFIDLIYATGSLPRKHKKYFLNEIKQMK